MANIANRSPWAVEHPGSEPKKFPRRKQAEEYASTLPAGKRPPKVVQLETTFEAQVIRTDSSGNVVRRSGTFDTRKEAEKWGKTTEDELLAWREKNKGFEAGFETITIRQALERLHAEHYAKKKSAYENSIRIRQIWTYFGEDTLFKKIQSKEMLAYFKWLDKDQKYAPSSIKNYFTVMSTLFRVAASTSWGFPAKNYCEGIELPKKDNAVRRNWRGNEEEKLFKSIEEHRAWILPIVRLALALTFRLGELVSSAKNRETGEQSHGLMWEGVDWKENTITLFQEKNDHQKSSSEALGRVVPLSEEAKAILLPLYEKAKNQQVLVHGEPTGPVFEGTRNSVSNAFRFCVAQAGITEFTFHTTRKIATYQLSKKITNAMMLSRITGHKNIEVLNTNYYLAKNEDLKAMMDGKENKTQVEPTTPQEMKLFTKGFGALTKTLGEEKAEEFLAVVRKVWIPEKAVT